MFNRRFFLVCLLWSFVCSSSHALSLWSCASRLIYTEYKEAPVPVSIRHFDQEGKVSIFSGELQLVKFEPRFLLGVSTVTEYRVTKGECPQPLLARLNDLARGWMVTRFLPQQRYLGPGRGYTSTFEKASLRVTNHAFESALAYPNGSLRQENGRRVEYERHAILLELRDKPKSWEGVSLSWSTWLDVTPRSDEGDAALASLSVRPDGFLEPEDHRFRVPVFSEE